MKTITFPSAVVSRRWFGSDRVGVYASVLCAIHCALTPILLLMLPAFGRAWSHPASHWAMALFVVPVAAFTLAQGFKRHRRRWVVGTGVLGIMLILAGAAVPYIGEKRPSASGDEASAVGGTESSSAPSLVMASASGLPAESEIAFVGEIVEPCASECESQVADTGTAECEDLCCPTLQASADGGWKLHIPLASILTTLGGLSLIATHLGNLCCSACKKPGLTA
ncbi:MerC domain-containing protein [Verrucomicrobiales bacterium]|nr:MerC domain-containing protein [Verrucomicrobiales bacterium]